jgi:hypothetical protein
LKEGRAVVFKMDIFKELVYLLPLDQPGASPVAVTVEDMAELQSMNERGEYPANLTDFAIEEEPNEMEDVYANVVGQDDLTRFDEERRRRKKRRSKSAHNRSGKSQQRKVNPDGKSESASTKGTGNNGNSRRKGRGNRNKRRKGNDTRSANNGSSTNNGAS